MQNEQRLLGDLKCTPTDPTLLAVHMVTNGALIGGTVIKCGETTNIGPSGGLVEAALALGSSVIALGGNKHKLKATLLALRNFEPLQCAEISGNIERDAAAIKELAPEDGVDVHTDSTPAEFLRPFYLSVASHLVMFHKN